MPYAYVNNAPVVQWIECELAELTIVVRFHTGAQIH